MCMNIRKATTIDEFHATTKGAIIKWAQIAMEIKYTAMLVILGAFCGDTIEHRQKMNHVHYQEIRIICALTLLKDFPFLTSIQSL